jgi:hypothetical protein
MDMVFLSGLDITKYFAVPENEIGFTHSAIRIRRILMILGLPDPYPDPLVTITDPDPSLFS